MERIVWVIVDDRFLRGVFGVNARSCVHWHPTRKRDARARPTPRKILTGRGGPGTANDVDDVDVPVTRISSHAAGAAGEGRKGRKEGG